LLQELDVPLNLGAVKLVPYAKGALVEYTRDLTGQETGRRGAAWALGEHAVSRLYPEIQSELFNLNGIYHKSIQRQLLHRTSDQPHQRLPGTGSVNDDASDEMLRASSRTSRLHPRACGSGPGHVAVVRPATLRDPSAGR